MRVELGCFFRADLRADAREVALQEVENAALLGLDSFESVRIADGSAEQAREGRHRVHFGMDRLAVALVDRAVHAVRLSALNAELERPVRRLLHRVVRGARVRRVRSEACRHDLIDGRPASPARAVPVATVEVGAVLRVVKGRARPQAGAPVRVLLAGAGRTHLEAPRNHELRLYRLERLVDPVQCERGFGADRLPIDGPFRAVGIGAAVGRKDEEQALRPARLLTARVQDRQERRERGAHAEGLQEPAARETGTVKIARAAHRQNLVHCIPTARTCVNASLKTMLFKSSRTL